MLSWLRVAALLRWVAVVVGACALTACGGGGGGSGNTTPASTYTLGGTVSGLTASGLVLVDSGTTLSVSSGATSFAFSSGLATGTGYAVSVQSAPAGLNCSVANGSGTIGSANVTNIAVTCVPQTHTLGGTVSGLAVNGLVLANGGATLTLNSGATTFAFPTALATGTAYEVSVQTQPAGEMCSVASGTGTVGTADIANVVVTCSLQSYTLGGGITGLTTGGLVLANGSDRLPVPAGASTFTLPTPVASTSSYTVTVATPPTGLSCSVANGTGTVGAANVTNIAVTCTDQPYALGGTITGLNGSGLVLANGTDKVSVAANASTFTLPTKVPYTAGYAVTVATQPVGLTCSVSAGTGSGNMPAGNVTSVAVVCADTAYTLGGTITGLTVAGLTLANGTDTVTVQPNAASFVFPTAVAYTSAYAVRVATQPNNLTCTVSSGAGKMPAAIVNNVVVTCSINSYTLGGSITGLTVGGLVLTDGTDNLSVASNAAAFTMPTALAYGSSYAVTVAALPVGWQCSVTGGTGTIPAANVTSVQVTCAAIQWTWEGGVQTSTASGASGNYVGPSPLFPAAREGQMTWTDSAGHFWMFGGGQVTSASGVSDVWKFIPTSINEFNDLWEFDATSNQWALISGSAPVAAPGATGSFTTAPYFPGGRHSGMVWTVNGANNGGDTVYLLGGVGLDSNGVDSYLNDLWVFQASTGQWSLIGAAHTTGNDFTGTPGVVGQFGNGWPSAREAAATWVDNSGRLWMFGGFYRDAGNNSQLLADLWVYDPNASEWAPMAQNSLNVDSSTGTQGVAATTNFPGARVAAATWKDSSGRLWLFGGGGFGAQTPVSSPDGLSDLWMLDPATAEWTWEGGPTGTGDPGSSGSQYVPAAGNWPSARGAVVSWTDASGNLWVFGGHPSVSATGLLSDLWMYNPGTAQWTWVSGLANAANVVPGVYGTLGNGAITNQPGARWFSSGWVDGAGQLWLLGGNGIGSDGQTGDLNDFWRF